MKGESDSLQNPSKDLSCFGVFVLYAACLVGLVFVGLYLRSVLLIVLYCVSLILIGGLLQQIPVMQAKYEMRTLRRCAENGDLDALFALGKRYQNGPYLVPDPTQAFKNYMVAAIAGHIKAQRALGKMLLNGEGIPIDVGSGTEWLRKAAVRGDKEARELLASHYYQFENDERSIRKAVKWYRLLAKDGDINAQKRLGDIFIHGRAFRSSPLAAAHWYRKAALQGDRWAQYELAWICRCAHGDVPPLDQAEALKWFEAAAGQGIPAAMLAAADMYRSGDGIQKAPEKALAWYTRAMEQGELRATLVIALMHYSGCGIRKDVCVAAEWFRKAADQGNPHGSAILAYLHEIGVGLPKDDHAAEQLYRAAATYIPGWCTLLWNYNAGDLLSDEIKSAINTRCCAETGDPAAQFRLGQIYCMGTDFPRDYISAYKWLNLSASSGNQEAALERDRLEQSMSAEQIAQGQRLSNAWQAIAGAIK